MLPVPMMNILNGGAHADNWLDFQEFMIVPVGLPRFSEALRMGAEVFHALKKILHDKGLHRRGRRGRLRARPARPTRRPGDPHRGHPSGRLHARRRGRAGAGPPRPGAVDKDSAYKLEHEGSGSTARDDRVLGRAVRQFPIVSIEDGMAEDDWDGWVALTQALGARCSWWATTCS